MLGMDIIIKRACEVDHVGEAILEFLLIFLMRWSPLPLGIGWERRKVVHEERVQDDNQIIMGIHALMSNYVISSLRARPAPGEIC